MDWVFIFDRPTALISYQNPTLIFVAIALAEIYGRRPSCWLSLLRGIGLIPKEYYEAVGFWRAMETICTHHSAIAAPIALTAFFERVILAFEVFAVVQGAGGTLFPVLMSETYAYQFELLNGSVSLLWR